MLVPTNKIDFTLYNGALQFEKHRRCFGHILNQRNTVLHLMNNVCSELRASRLEPAPCCGHPENSDGLERGGQYGLMCTCSGCKWAAGGREKERRVRKPQLIQRQSWSTQVRPGQWRSSLTPKDCLVPRRQATDPPHRQRPIPMLHVHLPAPIPCWAPWAECILLCRVL